MTYIFQDAPNGASLPLTPPLRSGSQCDFNSFSPSFQSNYCARLEDNSETVDIDHPNDVEPLPLGDGPEISILARQALLATLPLPADIPDDALNPILIPQPYTLHEFLGNASGTLKSS